MTFLKPVYIGNALMLSTRLNYVKRYFMEVEVTVKAEDLDIREAVLTGHCVGYHSCTRTWKAN